MANASTKRRPSNPALREIPLPLPENEHARTALAWLIADDPVPPKIVFLAGPAGGGKSLLIRDLLYSLDQKDAGFPPEQATASRAVAPKIASLTAGDWAAEFALASEKQQIPRFQQKYRRLDLFVLEDIADLQSRPETQEQLIAVIDELQARGSRMILSARVGPGSLTDISPRLVDRWHSAAFVNVPWPCSESRLALLEHFARLRRLPITPDALQQLAERLPVSPRELRGHLTDLEAHARAARVQIDVDFVQKHLQADEPPPALTLSRITHAVAKHFGVSVSGLRTGDRSRGIVRPRQCAMFLARELTKEPLQSIAKFYGRRHHSTVAHACTRIADEIEEEPALRRQLADIRSALQP